MLQSSRRSFKTYQQILMLLKVEMPCYTPGLLYEPAGLLSWKPLLCSQMAEVAFGKACSVFHLCSVPVWHSLKADERTFFLNRIFMLVKDASLRLMETQVRHLPVEFAQHGHWQCSQHPHGYFSALTRWKPEQQVPQCPFPFSSAWIFQRCQCSCLTRKC